MSDQTPGSASSARAGMLRTGSAAIVRGIEACGESVAVRVRFLGGLAYLFGDACLWSLRGLFQPRVKFGRQALAYQMVRVGVRSIPIIILVEMFVGVILALQLAPTLQDYGQIERIADVVAIAIFRELGPLISAIVLSGFAGASIAAEIGAMNEAEELKALRAHALNPIHYLVVPRIWATVFMLTGLCVIADVVGAFGGLITAWGVLGISPTVYIEYTQQAIEIRDFVTGLVKAGVFGLLISLIACYEGMNVSGGAEGVGLATTATVVKSIVALIGTDVLFTAVFFAFGL